jgi:hypothetical protein
MNYFRNHNIVRLVLDFSSFVMEIESVVANKTLLAWRFQLPEHHLGFQIQILTQVVYSFIDSAA